MRGIRPEPTGFDSSVANFLPLPITLKYSLPQASRRLWGLTGNHTPFSTSLKKSELVTSLALAILGRGLSYHGSIPLTTGMPALPYQPYSGLH